MNVFKKMMVLGAALLLATAALTGCGTSADAAGKAEVWNIASIQTEDHPQTQAVIYMGELFSEMTDGRYEFKVYANELLGPQRETLEQVQYGIIEMAIMGNPNISSFVDEFLTFEMPFLFDDVEHQQTYFTDASITGELYEKVEQYNFKIATYFTAGTRNMYSYKPIQSPDDLKGMKIRTAESDTYSKMMRAFGGAATPMSMGEVFTAIQSGVVDGAENNEASYANTKHYEIAQYYSYTQHLIVPDFLIVNQKLYEGLSDEDRAKFDEAARMAAEYEAQLWNEYSQKSIQQAVDGGATVVEDVDAEAFQDAVKDLHAELCENPAIKETYDKVKALSNFN